MKKGKFNTVVDASWGSSGKGAVSTRLADIHGITNLSSGNYPNAGHSAIHKDIKFVSKALPTGAILTKFRDRKPNLWIGPNSGFEEKQLSKELEETGYKLEDLFMHERAMIVEPKHIAMEAPSGEQSTLHISSTMSGSGAAYTYKAMRRADTKIGRELYPSMSPWDFFYGVRNQLMQGNSFLHEVSQGFALSVNYGTHYPQATFRDCTPQQSYNDFGITPELVGDVYLNVRSLPIRVGNNFDAEGNQIGYSGDVWPGQKELTWEEVGKEAEMPLEEIQALAERERTTVTKKIRRVFTPSWELLKYASDFCGATKMVLNFPQYIHWSAYKVRGGKKEFELLHPKVIEYVKQMEAVTGIQVVMIGTGPEHEDYIFLE